MDTNTVFLLCSLNSLFICPVTKRHGGNATGSRQSMDEYRECARPLQLAVMAYKSCNLSCVSCVPVVRCDTYTIADIK
jgi:hypothetical protein